MKKAAVIISVCAVLLVAVLGCSNGTTVVVELSGLSLSDGTLTPAFDTSVTTYTATVPNATDSIEVTVTLDSEPGIAVTINGSDVIPGTGTISIALDVGENVISVVVTYEGETKTYTVTVTREAAPPAPEIKITGPVTYSGAIQDIPSGTEIDFGFIAFDPHDMSFTIENIGSADLTLSATPPDYISITGTDSENFLVTLQPTEATIPPEGSQTFTIEFIDSGSTSDKYATATIENNDDDEGTFLLSLFGVNTC